MQVGLALPHYDFSFPDKGLASVGRVLDYAQRAEDLGYDSVWVSDHLFLDLSRYGGPAKRFGTPEAMTVLAAIAATTSRVRLGPLVLCASFRQPRILAEQMRTISDCSRGRFEVGIGAGWYEAEFREAGIPFGTAGQRIERLRTVTRLLGQTLDPRPPIWVGGKGGPKVMSVVAEHADGWNTVWRWTPEAYRERLDALNEACAAVGRDPASVRLSVGLYTLLGTDEVDLERRYRELQRWTPGGALDEVSLDEYRKAALVGTPDECAKIAQEFEAFGVDTLVCSPAGLPFSVYDDEQLELIARELIPRVQ